MAEKFVSENPSVLNALEFHERERTHSPIDYIVTQLRVLYRNQVLGKQLEDCKISGGFLVMRIIN